MLRAFYVAFNSTAGRVGFAPLVKEVGAALGMEIRNRWSRIVWVPGDVCRVRATSRRRIRARNRTAMHTIS